MDYEIKVPHTVEDVIAFGDIACDVEINAKVWVEMGEEHCRDSGICCDYEITAVRVYVREEEHRILRTKEELAPIMKLLCTDEANAIILQSIAENERHLIEEALA